MQVPKQEKEHKKKCLLPDNGANGLPLPRGNAPTAALSNLDASVAAVKAQSLDEEVAEESQKVYAKPLPLNNQQQSQYKPRSGRRFQQQQQQQQRFSQQQRFAQQQQHNGQFVQRGF